MISSLVTSTVLSVLTASAFAQNVDKRLAKPVNANLTTIEIPLDPTAPDATEASVNQTVSYFAAKGHGDTPLAIVQGDVIISTVPELLSNASPVNGTNNALAKRSYSIWSTQNFWTGGVVHYKWLDEDAKGLGRLEAWTEATKRWTDMLPWLKFQQHASSATLTEDIMTLVPTVGQGGCFSPIGKAYSAYSNQMMLDDGCGGAGTYAHELGHTLGLIHEHMRPDRDDYVIIHCDAVWDSSDGTPADCSQSCTGYGCNFRKYDPTYANWSTPYDSLSLMHYAPYEFGKGPGPAIEARPGVSTPTEHTFPTIKDAQKVCELYSDKCTNVCGDGVVSGEEQCDDGNNFDGDGCNAGCKREGEDVCGDGIITAGEECDDGNTVDGDGCSATCKLEKHDGDSTTPPDTCSLSACNPWAAASCDITTSCTALGGATQGGVGQHLCACRHGYRASGYAADDESVQVRLPWKEQGRRVFVKPGVACEQLCDEWTLGIDGCKEVRESPACY